MKYSKIIGGVLVMFAGALIAQFGFSEGCSSEIMEKLTPIIGMLPGGIFVYISRLMKGDVTPVGFIK